MVLEARDAVRFRLPHSSFLQIILISSLFPLSTRAAFFPNVSFVTLVLAVQHSAPPVQSPHRMQAIKHHLQTPPISISVHNKLTHSPRRGPIPLAQF